MMINYRNRRKKIKSPLGKEADHIIPFAISMDNSPKNIQFLTKKEHRIKTGKERRIINKFRKKGWIERVTYYSYELMIPKEKLKEEYLKEFNKI